MMTLADKATRYARDNPQQVTLSWVDGSTRTYDALKAVGLCAVPAIAACIMGAQARDTALQAMLDELIDGD